ncbi:MAG: methyltransferase domain-containing protein [Bacteroidales bacterium]
MDGGNGLRRTHLVLAGALALSCVLAAPWIGAAQDADGRARQREEARREGWQRVPEILVAVGAVPGARLADVGAGDGFFTVRLARAVGPRGHVTAVDISATALERLRRRLADEGITNADTIQGDSADADLAAGSLDGILIVNAYHEMERHEQTLARLHRALRPGGRLVLVEPLRPEVRGAPRDRQTQSHSLAAGFAATELRAAGFAITSLQDPFATSGYIEEWMLVAQRTTSPAPAQADRTGGVPADAAPPPIGPELEKVGSEEELAAETLRITLGELKPLLARDAVLVLDIGDQRAYEDGHVPGAILVPLGVLAGRLDALKATKKAIVAYCR